MLQSDDHQLHHTTLALDANIPGPGLLNVELLFPIIVFPSIFLRRLPSCRGVQVDSECSTLEALHHSDRIQPE